MIFRFCRDNFYPVGCRQVQGTTAEWLQFTVENGRPLQQFINGFSPLDYQALTSTGGREGLGDVQISCLNLVRAVDKLATTTDQQSLLVVIIMISESLRYRDIEDFVFSNYDNGSTLPPPLQAPLIYGPSLTFVHEPLFPPTKHGRLRAEIFSVCINHTRKKISLYGTIMVAGSSKWCIYNRQERDAEPVGPGENCTLTGPVSRCILALDSFGIRLNLRKSAGLGVVVNDVIGWDALANSIACYDRLWSATVNGMDGASATVNFKVFTAAVQATVTVVLKESREAALMQSGKMCVYGEVIASKEDSPLLTIALSS